MANAGWETFLSYEDPEQDILIGLLRLRRCSAQSFRPELKGGVSIVRELHVYGSVVPVSSRDPSKFHHQVHTHTHTQKHTHRHTHIQYMQNVLTFSQHSANSLSYRRAVRYVIAGVVFCRPEERDTDMTQSRRGDCLLCRAKACVGLAGCGPASTLLRLPPSVHSR